MKKRVKMRLPFLTGVLLLCLCVLLLGISVLPVSADGAVIGKSFNYGNPGRDRNKNLSAAEFASLLLERSPSSDETAVLENEGFGFAYNDEIPDSLISTDYNGGAGTLTVTVLPYRYTAANGEPVEWLPVSVTLAGVTQALTGEGGSYRTVFSGLFYSENFKISVSYRWDLSVPAETVNHFDSIAYLRGKAALDAENAYLSALKTYNEKKQAYAAYTAYLADLSAYNAYLTRKADYDDALAKYNTYLAQYAAYEAEKSAYDQWQAYYDYVDFLNNHLGEYNAYLLYLRDMEKIAQKLNILDSIFTKDSHGWVLYNSILGGTVEKVVSHQDELIDILHCSAEDVHLAGESTEKLRVLLKNYNTLRQKKYATDYARTAALYTFYGTHYGELKQNFTDLCSALYALYQNDYVRREMREQGKIDHYQQFVGQLYVVATALDDSGNRKTDWTISNKTLNDVVESKQRIPDLNTADPASLPLPAETPVVEKPAAAEKPTVPQPSSLPAAPKPVADPGAAPVPVAKPVEIPAAADPGGIPPIPPETDELSRRLAGAIADGTLAQPVPRAEAKVLTFDAALERDVSIRNLKTVVFHDMNGNVLHTAAVDFGGRVHFDVPIPADTAQYRYTVRGWVDWDGSSVNLDRVEKDLSLYPLYEKTLLTYHVTWIVDGTEYVSVCYYGTLPVPPLTPSRDEETHYYYVFSGWDREIVPVTGDTAYTGTLIRCPKTYTVTWITQNGTVSQKEIYTYGETPVFKEDLSIPNDRNVYTFTGWDHPLTSVDGDAVYTALYTRTPLVSGGSVNLDVVCNDKAITVSGAVENGTIVAGTAFGVAASANQSLLIRYGNGTAFSLDAGSCAVLAERGAAALTLRRENADHGSEIISPAFTDGEGQEITDPRVTVTMELPERRELNRFGVYRVSGSEEDFFSGGTVVLAAGNRVTLCWLYGIDVVPNGSCNIASIPRSAQAGDVITVRPTCLYGYEITAVSVTNASGTSVPVENDSFIMPDYSVIIDFTVEKIVYRVRFVSEGVTVSEAEYALGDEILLPNDPKKAETDDYVYTFTDWSPVPPMIASGAERVLTFTAQFSKVKKNIQYETGHNNNVLFEVILPCVGGGILLLAAALTVFLILRKRAKRRKAAEQAASAADQQNPVEPIEPSEPIGPVEPVEPAESVDAAETDEPTDDVEPTESAADVPSEGVNADSPSDL